MADILAIGAAWLAQQQSTNVAREVTYSRATGGSVVVPATLGQSPLEVTDENGVSVTARLRDYIIRRDLLVIDEAEVEPAAGDRITDGTMVYEVMGIPGEAHARDTDQYRYQHRIHTKFIGNA